MTREDVAKCLEFILKGKPYIWGDFTDVPIQDPELDKIRLRVLELEVSHPPDNSNEYINREGQRIIQSIIQELRNSTGADKA